MTLGWYWVGRRRAWWRLRHFWRRICWICPPALPGAACLPRPCGTFPGEGAPLHTPRRQGCPLRAVWHRCSPLAEHVMMGDVPVACFIICTVKHG